MGVIPVRTSLARHGWSGNAVPNSDRGGISDPKPIEVAVEPGVLFDLTQDDMHLLDLDSFRPARPGGGVVWRPSLRDIPASPEGWPLDNPDLWMYCKGWWIIDPLGSFGDNDGD
jgi:hypothetical protein